jgi:hypothetical protein
LFLCFLFKKGRLKEPSFELTKSTWPISTTTLTTSYWGFQLEKAAKDKTTGDKGIDNRVC